MNGITNAADRNYAHAGEATNSKTAANQNKMENIKNAAKNERPYLMFLELTALIKKIACQTANKKISLEANKKRINSQIKGFYSLF